MSDLNDVVGQLSALRGVLAQMNQQMNPSMQSMPQMPVMPQMPSMPMPQMPAPPSWPMPQASPSIDAAALLRSLMPPPPTQAPAPTTSPEPVVDEVLRREVRELKEQSKSIIAQVQGLASAMQLMATQMAALAQTTRMRLETLAAASTSMAKPKASPVPTEETIPVEVGRPLPAV